MNLEDIQPFIVSRLIGYPPLGGVTVLAEDGTYSQDLKARQDALNTCGLCLTVDAIYSGGLIDASTSGVAVEEIELLVLVEENPPRNRATSGTGIVAPKAMRLVREALLGAHYTGDAQVMKVRVGDPPFANLGWQNGAFTFANFFLLTQGIQPIHAVPPLPPFQP